MDVVLYSIGISHPSQAARKMLELKGVDYELVDIAPSLQRLQLRLAGFRGGTVPAIKLDGRRIQGSRQIAQELDRLWPEPPLYPSDPQRRAAVEVAERWGEEQLQPIPRRLFRYGLAHDRALAHAMAGRPPRALAILVLPAVQLIAAYYARTIEADGRRATAGGIRADLQSLPRLLDHVDQLLVDGTLTLEPPNAAALQVLSSVRVLHAFDDLADLLAGRACSAAALELFGPPSGAAPRFLPRSWLP